MPTTALRETEDQSFDNKTVVIDGKSFLRCTFNDCRIVYRGGVSRMASCYVGAGCEWRLENAAFSVVEVLKEIGWTISAPPPLDQLQNPTK